MEYFVITSLKKPTPGVPGVKTKMVKPVAAGGAAATDEVLTVHDPKEIAVKSYDLTKKDLADVRRDPSTIGSGPKMPTYLIRAKPSKDDDTEAAGKPPKVSWGVKAVGALNSPTTGSGVVVAVLDTGIDKSHPAFKGMEFVTKNFTQEADQDIDGHGTHCAGTIFGRDVDGTRIGVARGVDKALIGKVIGKGGGSTFSVIEAIQWAWQNGARIISLSLGIDFPGFAAELQEEEGYPPTVAASLALYGFLENVRAFDRLSSLVSATGPGLAPSSLLVAATGNESLLERNPKFKVYLSPPAVGEDFLSVGAIMQVPGNGNSKKGYALAPFSNIGGRIAAPGVGIWSARPKTLGGGLTAFDGTSMATPHVAGVAALWVERFLQSGEAINGRELAREIQSEALKLPKLSREDVGAGLVQAPK